MEAANIRNGGPELSDKIWYYGIMSLANSKTKMDDCFRLLKAARFNSFYEGLSTYEILEEILGKDPFTCRCCETGKMVYGLSEGKGKEPWTQYNNVL